MLANKYRPQQFADFVGQDTAINLIRQSIIQNSVSQSIMLSGMHGIGKTSLARVIAKAINCTNFAQGNEPCNHCENCQLITASNHPDVVEIDAASNTSVDHMRQIISNSQYLPIKAKYKINIIDEAHMLSDSAFNSLLKTLEEPNISTIFILATTKAQKIPKTIISRCQQYNLSNLTTEQISKHLIHVLTKLHKKYDTEAVHNIAEAARGSMRNALFYLEQALCFDDDHMRNENVQNMLNMQYDLEILKLLEHIINHEKNAAFESINSLISKVDISEIIKTLLTLIHQIVVMIYLDDENAQKQNSALRALAKKINVLAGHRLWCIGWKYLKMSSQILLKEILEMMVVEMTCSLHISANAQDLAREMLQKHDSKHPQHMASDNQTAPTARKAPVGIMDTAPTARKTPAKNTSPSPANTPTTRDTSPHLSSQQPAAQKHDQTKDALADIQKTFSQAKIEIHKKEK